MKAEIPKNIKDSIKNTVGYVEATNKEKFMVGANVAFSISEKYFSPIIDDLEKQVIYYKSAYESVRNDMETIVKTFNKYDYD